MLLTQFIRVSCYFGVNIFNGVIFWVCFGQHSWGWTWAWSLFWGLEATQTYEVDELIFIALLSSGLDSSS